VSTHKWGRAQTDVPHWVYIYFNDNEPAPERRVLYVGFTNDMQARDAAHRRSGRGWREHATRLVLTEYSDRDSAFAAEGHAIGQYTPINNLNTNSHRAEVHREYLVARQAKREAEFQTYWTALRERTRDLRAS
jgi:predicted GIY-YIG superfamily endonuclease